VPLIVPCPVRRVVWALGEQHLGLDYSALGKLASRAVEMLPEISPEDAHTLVSAFNKLGFCGGDVSQVAQKAAPPGVMHSIDAD
jgi:hypothetical protein